MNDYTFDDIRKMQDEAKKRVYEMQQRSKAAADNFRGEKKNDLLPETPKSISMPVDFPERQKGVEDEVKNKISKHSAFSLFNEKPETEEAEKMLILALCILLESEHADNALILALMYLMT